MVIKKDIRGVGNDSLEDSFTRSICFHSSSISFFTL